jgi:NADH-quinone oxidoreductase subunit N
MALMVSSLNLLMIVIAIEAASLPSYAIVGFDKRDRVGAEASLKYMIFGAISAAIMLYGASLLYGLVGSLGMADVARYTVNQLGLGRNSVLLSVGLICFFSGIAFKISAVPFHFWCPDAFEGAKIEVTTWLSVASKAAGLVLLVRLVLVICDSVGTPMEMSLVRPLAWGIGMVAAVTCTIGNFSAYKQHSVKRLLAYSSIAHAGYMMMAAAVFIHPDIPSHASGLTAMLVYLVIYVFMNLGAFGVTAIVTWETGSDKIEAFAGLMRRAPWAAIPMVICLVSLVGIPPMAGFMAKWWILLALGGLQDAGGPHGVAPLGTLGWVLVVVVVANTLFSLFYYMRVVVQMTLRDDDRPAMRVPLGGLAIVNVCAVALLVLFVFAEPLRNGVQEFTTELYRATTSASDPAVASTLEKFIDPRND